VKTLYRLGGALALLMMLSTSAQAEMRVMSSFPVEVKAIIDNEISARFPGATIKLMVQTSQFSDAGIYDLPESDWASILQHDDQVDVDKANELGLLFSFTSSKRFDLKYTHGSKKMDDLYQYLLRRARGDASVRGLSKTVLADRTLPNYVRAVVWIKIEIPKGGYNPVRRDIVYRPELADSMAAIREALNRRAGPIEQDIEVLKLRSVGGGLQPGDIGLSAFVGYSSYQINGHTFNGGTVGMTYRYMDFALEGFAGELFSNSREMESMGEELTPKYTNNHFEGASIYWAPMQTGYEWGKYWKLGATGMHAQRDNIENFSNLDVYYAGGAGILSLPIRRGLTIEGQGTIGYGWSTMASESYETAPTKSQGLGYGLRGALVLGRR